MERRSSMFVGMNVRPQYAKIVLGASRKKFRRMRGLTLRLVRRERRHVAVVAHAGRAARTTRTAGARSRRIAAKIVAVQPRVRPDVRLPARRIDQLEVLVARGVRARARRSSRPLCLRRSGSRNPSFIPTELNFRSSYTLRGVCVGSFWSTYDGWSIAPGRYCRPPVRKNAPRKNSFAMPALGVVRRAEPVTVREVEERIQVRLVIVEDRQPQESYGIWKWLVE